MTANVLFLVEETEFEAGWGQRPDGFACFLTKAEGDAYVLAQHAKHRGGPTPENYSVFDSRGYFDAHPTWIEAVTKAKEKGREIWIRSKREISIPCALPILKS